MILKSRSTAKIARLVFFHSCGLIVREFLMVIVVLCSFAGAAGSALADDSQCRAQWIWHPRKLPPGQKIYLRREFHLSGELTAAKLRGVFDFCDADLLINGRRLLSGEAFGPAWQADATDHLRAGKNILGLRCHSVDGPAAVMLRLDLEFADGRRESMVTDGSWRTAMPDGDSPRWPEHGQTTWHPARMRGAVSRIPWDDSSPSIGIGPLDDYTQWKQALGADTASRASTFQTQPGFEVRMIRSARADEDSWVSLAQDGQGRWIIGQEKRGLLRLTINSLGDARVETVNDSLAECRGLLFVGPDLYAMANNDKALYRLRDTNGDDRFDEVTRLAEFAGDVGHGRNQITLGPDGRLYGIFGDAVHEPPSAHALIPRIRHADDIQQTRSGFVARMDLDSHQWELVTRGLRNPFGIAFDRHGEMFTYDADAEYDMGASWYRPTRVVHLMPGGDYGWRRVTGQWPPYFSDRADIPLPTLDIGKGSPTAVVFGHDGGFPWPWRRALFVLDWAYGRILAVHLEPRGSGFAASAETFLRGRPLNVTDVEFGRDGAMHFVTGGRGTQSALYRVAWLGAEVDEPAPTLQQQDRREHAAGARHARHRLQSLFGRHDSATVDIAWPYLSSSDPWLRHAARTALEWQPAESWQTRALNETEPDAALAAWLALLRVGSPDVCRSIAPRLNRYDLRLMSERQKLESIFIAQRCLDGSNNLTKELRHSLVQQLDRLYPDDSPAVNQRLSLVLSQLEVPGFVRRSMSLLTRADTQQHRFHYLFVLRSATSGWTPPLRESYFEHLKQAVEFTGGEGMPRFRQSIESEALAALPEKQRARFADFLKTDPAQRWQQEYGARQREFVRQWTIDDFPGVLDQLHQARDLERGERLFGEARCILCHRLGPRGGVAGPDLTSVSRRFTPRDLLVSIMEPSKIIADNYRGTTLLLHDGRVVTGRIVSADYRSDKLYVIADPLAPAKSVEISKQNVQQHQPSSVSPMPQGLLDTLSKSEVLDLLAYIMTAESSASAPPGEKH